METWCFLGILFSLPHNKADVYVCAAWNAGHSSRDQQQTGPVEPELRVRTHVTKCFNITASASKAIANIDGSSLPAEPSSRTGVDNPPTGLVICNVLLVPPLIRPAWPLLPPV